MAEKLTEPRTVDGGRVVVDEVLETGAATARFRGYLEADPQQKRLVTLGGEMTAPLPDLRRSLAMEIAGIAGLDFIGPVDRPDDLAWRGACLVEVEPRGQRVDELLPLAEADVASLGRQIAEVIARAHAKQILVRGIRPELVYVDGGIGGASRLVGLVPRAPLFLDATRPASHGMPLLPELYRAPEDQFGHAPEPRSDVFALCATLFALSAGFHPFGEHPREQMDRMLAEDPVAHPWGGRLPHILAAGLAREPGRRPDLDALAAQLAPL